MDFRIKVSAVEARLVDLHDQASAVQEAHEKLTATAKEADEYKKGAEKRLKELEQAAKPASNIRVVQLNSLPRGYVMWFHSHVNPQVAALCDPHQTDKLREAHPKAFVSTTMPEGIVLDVDHNAVAAELRAFPGLEHQLDVRVPHVLEDKQFWINYFSHKHGIKIGVSARTVRLMRTACIHGIQPG